MPEYYVVFEGVGGEHSNYEGIRTITLFDSEEDFLAWKSGCNNRDLVVGQGLTYEEARALAAETSGEARARAALKDAGNNPNHLPYALRNAAWIAGREHTLFEFTMELARHGVTEDDLKFPEE